MLALVGSFLIWQFCLRATIVGSFLKWQLPTMVLQWQLPRSLAGEVTWHARGESLGVTHTRLQRACMQHAWLQSTACGT